MAKAKGRGGRGGRKSWKKRGRTDYGFYACKKDFPLFFLLCESEGCEKGEGRGRVPAYHTPRAKEEGGREGGCVCVTGRPPPPM